MRNKQVYFHYADAKPLFSNKRLLQDFIPVIFKKEGKKLESLSFIFCSDNYLLEINKQFLKHDYYTDIISFDLSEPKSALISGEIYISVDRVKENAKDMRISFKEEMKRVLFHGTLHLCGYRDKKKADVQQMRAKEDEYLKLFEKYIG
ncbi:MAG: rRNA maturation RNase YbeY [Chitinophagaceae bacterium]|nr:rRNA maturation RNase YbeY [Chitinophagaceae bacterium]